MAFKFIHTADIHLDSPLKTLALRNEGLAELVGNASRTVFKRIVDLCLSENVQALIIAGDLYDGAQTSMKTARFLATELTRLAQAEIPAFVIRGNHDALSKITKELVLPDSVKIFSGRAEVVETIWNSHPVAVHGISFRQPHAPDSLLPHFKPAVPGAFNLGLLHTSLGGAQGHDPYAPCTVADLQETGFDYWALGHIHQRAEYPGATTIVMPGIPQGRDIGEAGSKSVSLVSVDDAGGLSVTERSLAVAQFERLPIACDGCDDWGDLVTKLRGAITAARRDHTIEHLILRPILTGSSPLAWRASRDVEFLLAEAQNAAESVGTLWIDKLALDLSHSQTSLPSGAIKELADLLQNAGSDHPDKAVQAELNVLLRKLPKDLRNLLGDTEDEVRTAWHAELNTGALEVLAQLDEGED